eukprot:6195011-Pleurochrysis_carterae.AAC.1
MSDVSHQGSTIPQKAASAVRINSRKKLSYSSSRRLASQVLVRLLHDAFALAKRLRDDIACLAHGLDRLIVAIEQLEHARLSVNAEGVVERVRLRCMQLRLVQLARLLRVLERTAERGLVARAERARHRQVREGQVGRDC